MIPYKKGDEAKMWDGEAQCKGKNVDFRFTSDSLAWDLEYP